MWLHSRGQPLGVADDDEKTGGKGYTLPPASQDAKEVRQDSMVSS